MFNILMPVFFLSTYPKLTLTVLLDSELLRKSPLNTPAGTVPLLFQNLM